MPASLCLIVVYFILIYFLVTRIITIVKNSNSDKENIILTLTIAIVLASTAYAPNGLLDFDQLEGKDVLIAGREGSANCSSTLKLKANGRFSTTIICFGIERTKGNYHIKRDTVFFEYDDDQRQDDHYEFGVVDSNQISWAKADGMYLYKNRADKSPNQLTIVLNKIRLKKHIPLNL